MIWELKNGGYILAAYGLTLLIVAALILCIVLDGRRQRDPGIVDDDVDAAKFEDGLLHGLDHRILAGDVHHHSTHVVLAIGSGESASHFIE